MTRSSSLVWLVAIVCLAFDMGYWLGRWDTPSVTSRRIHQGSHRKPSSNMGNVPPKTETSVEEPKTTWVPHGPVEHTATPPEVVSTRSDVAAENETSRYANATTKTAWVSQASVGKATTPPEIEQGRDTASSPHRAGENTPSRPDMEAENEKNKQDDVTLPDKATNNSHDIDNQIGSTLAGLFWKAYGAQRYTLLSRGDGEGDQHSATKYLVFSPTDGDLASHMVGMMSTFVLSVALGRVFVHDWNSRTAQCGATYDELFMPPYSPWSLKAERNRVSSAEGFLFDAAAESAGTEGKTEQQVWNGLPRLKHPRERNSCTMDLTLGGIKGGGLDTTFITKKGEDPRPDCRTMHITTDQYLVQALADSGYGAPDLGGVSLTKWLGDGTAVKTLLAGLFRPVDAVSRRVEDTAAQIFSQPGQMLAGYALASRLNVYGKRQQFISCVEDWGHQNNTKVILASDIVGFAQESSKKLRLAGLDATELSIVATTGRERRGGGSKTRRAMIEKTQTTLVELLLVSKADVVVTSPGSVLSAVAAAGGGPSTQRIGSASCKEIDNEPELQLLECVIPQRLDPNKWRHVYSFVDSNRERCLG